MTASAPVIDWHRLRNPVLSVPDWSLKDACMVQAGGRYHIFTSAFDQDRSTVVHYITTDWRSFAPGPLRLIGPELGAVGICSPNLWWHAGRWYLQVNTWGQPPPVQNQLYYLVSDDLATWSAPRPLAPALTRGARCIDLALAQVGPFWVAGWKDGNHPRFAVAEDLDGEWRAVDGGRGRLRRRADQPSGGPDLVHENFQIFRLDHGWHLLSTDYEPHEPWLYTLAGDPARPASWAEWEDGVPLVLPAEDFNSFPADRIPVLRAAGFTRPIHPCPGAPGRVAIVDGFANAPYLADWRDHDGFLYLLYAGKNEIDCDRYRGRLAGGIRREGWPRGWNRLALARSRDGRRWQVPPVD